MTPLGKLRRTEKRKHKREREKGMSLEEVRALRLENDAANGGNVEKTKENTRKNKRGRNTRFLRRRNIKLLEAQNHRCCYCGDPMWYPKLDDGDAIPHHDTNRATVEHVVARTKGGSNFKHNFAMACSECNSVRGCMNLDKFIALITGKEIVVLDKPIRKILSTMRLLYIGLTMQPELFAKVLEESDDIKFKLNLKQTRHRSLGNVQLRVIENCMTF